MRYVYALCQRGGKREGKRARSGSGSELWQHMRARDSHGAPFVRVNATCYSMHIRACVILAALARSLAIVCARRCERACA